MNGFYPLIELAKQQLTNSRLLRLVWGASGCTNSWRAYFDILPRDISDSDTRKRPSNQCSGRSASEGMTFHVGRITSRARRPFLLTTPTLPHPTNKVKNFFQLFFMSNETKFICLRLIRNEKEQAEIKVNIYAGKDRVMYEHYFKESKKLDKAIKEIEQLS